MLVSPSITKMTTYIFGNTKWEYLYHPDYNIYIEINAFSKLILRSNTKYHNCR